MTNPDYDIDTSHYDECLNAMLRHKNRHRIRSIIMLILSITNGYFHIAFYANIAIAGIYIGVFSILYMLAVMVLSFFSTSDKPVLVILTVAMYALGLWYAYSPIFGVPLLIMYGLQLFECPKAIWLKKQRGYPYFSERFNDQQKIAFRDYDSTYEVDDNAGEMKDVAGEKDVLFAEKVTMPGVPDLPNAMPEPLEKSIPHLNEVPAAASVPPPPEKEETIIPEVAVLNAPVLAPVEEVENTIPDFEEVEAQIASMQAAEKKVPVLPETEVPILSEEIAYKPPQQPDSVMKGTAQVHSEDTSHYQTCRDIIRRHKRSYKVRTIILLVLCVLCLLVCAIFDEFAGVLMALFLFAAGYFSVSDKPVTIAIMLVMCLFGMIDVSAIAIPLLIMYALQLTECRKALWVKQQPGYPYFNERFNEQLRTSFQEYEADHPLNAASGEVKFEPVGTQPVPSKTVRPKKTAPLPVQPAGVPLTPVQDVPSVSEIPAPVWDVPDPVMDTSIITSDFPEINGEIPDLPDIPDIPKI